MRVIHVARHAVSLGQASQAGRCSSGNNSHRARLHVINWWCWAIIHIQYAYVCWRNWNGGKWKLCGKQLKGKINLVRILYEYYSVVVTSREGKANHTMIRTDMLETRVEPPAQKNVPKTICKSQVTIKHAKRHGVLSTAHPTNAPLVQHELQL